MTTVVRFLEQIGARPLPEIDYQCAVAALDVCPQQQSALARRDGRSLEFLLDGRSNMLCMVMAADET
jgi:hypothetical protein